MRILSLGAGVQSSTLLLMAAKGEFEHMPDAAIFADTGWEPKAVYEWLDWLEEEVRGVIPIYRVSAGSLRQHALTKVTPKRATAKREWYLKATIPMYTLGPNGERGMLARHCTRTYKVEVVEAMTRRLLGVGFGQRMPEGLRAEMWMGISTDEVLRMKPSRRAWITARWPLIEHRMSRTDCLRWMERNGHPLPPKSACVGCPYASDDRWLAMKREAPEEFADAVAFERELNIVRRTDDHPAFLHASRIPLDTVDFEKLVEESAARGWQPDLFNGDCEGMCGV